MLVPAVGVNTLPHQTIASELQDVPFHSDNTTLCGPSALASVLQFSGVNVSVEELTRDVYLPGRKGSLQVEILSAIHRRHHVAYAMPPQTDAIARAVSNRFPVLVLLNLGLDFAPSWHYAVVVGTQDQADGKRDFLLRSGTQRRQIMTEELFARVWKRSSHWAIIVAPPAQTPSFLGPKAALDGILSLNSTDAMAARKTALESARQVWPSDPLLTFALASDLQQSGEADKAEMLWRTLATQTGQPAATANLAALLNQQGRIEEAAQWACRARSELGRQALSDKTRDRILMETTRIINAANRDCQTDETQQTRFNE